MNHARLRSLLGDKQEEFEIHSSSFLVHTFRMSSLIELRLSQYYLFH